MKKALIPDAALPIIVSNVIELPDDWTGADSEWKVPAGHILIDALDASQGDTWDGTTFAKNVAPSVTVITLDQFEARFTTAEWDAATDYVYKTDIATGLPKHRALIQGLSRATRRNSVDLLDAKTDAFLGALVAGNVITSPRKTEILAL